MGDESSGRENEAGNRSEEESLKRARDMLEYIETQVERGKAGGVDFSEMEAMLSGARIMIESGELEDAVELIGICTEKAGKRFSEHEKLVFSIRRTERDIKAAHDSGKDVSEAGRLLKLARVHMERGDYVLGIESAKHALETLTQKKPTDIVWGSGLAES
ncbi:MAG: hypothetical protein KKH41_05030 [Candidatus Thermoplasmatota archaeon]|nr:hypothetical protein [Euryarchaeota archaeon]MBU4591930.1 hypothetical protein [Candidatus Thermoplasmatota archaeon]